MPWHFAAIVFASLNIGLAHAAPFMIVGNDEKLLWDDDGKRVLFPAGKDSVVILDLADPENPKIVANLPLKNSVVGPPVNVAIDPTNTIALVADSVDVTKDGDTLKMAPDNKVYVIDLKTDPPKLAGTMTVGKQPSGLSFNPPGDLALVANSADKSISVLAVKGTDVKVIDTIDMGDIVSHVTFTPDGKHALAAKFNAHKVALLDVNGDKVTYTKLDLPTGQWPFNVAVAPSGRIALSADSGNSAGSDGSVDTVSVIDLEAKPPRIIDRVVVGDGPEGLAISPKGDVAVAVILAGSNMKNAYFYHRNGAPIGAADRRQKSDPYRRYRGRRHAGRGGVHARRKIFAGRQLSRPGRIHPQGRWRDHHEHRQTFQAAWPSGLDWDEQAITERDILP